MNSTTMQQGAAAAEAQARAIEAQAAQAAEAAARAAQDAARAQEEAAQSQAERISEQVARQIERDVERALEQGNISTQQGGRQVIELPNGQRIIINGTSVRFDNAITRGNSGDELPMRAIEVGKQITLFVCMTIAVVVVGLPIARAFARWLDRRGTASVTDPNTAARLAAIENAIDSVAVEVERISEGQRFTTRLLNERAAERVG